MEGVYRTRVGYAGGSLENPNYRNLGDHTETFQVDYDPTIISYDDILELFWEGHNPTGRAPRQYMSIILSHDDDQKIAALESKAAFEEKMGIVVTTEIVALDKFYLAEDYHQKYYLQAVKDLAAEIKAYYPSFSGFIDSTAAARINGFIGGYGDSEQMAAEIESYGLSPDGEKRLVRFANGSSIRSLY